MKRKRFSVEQITGILKQAELGAPVAGGRLRLFSFSSGARVTGGHRLPDCRRLGASVACRIDSDVVGRAAFRNGAGMGPPIGLAAHEW